MSNVTWHTRVSPQPGLLARRDVNEYISVAGRTARKMQSASVCNRVLIGNPFLSPSKQRRPFRAEYDPAPTGLEAPCAYWRALPAFSLHLCRATRFYVASDELDHNLWHRIVSVNAVGLMRQREHRLESVVLCLPRDHDGLLHRTFRIRNQRAPCTISTSASTTVAAITQSAR
jgi:hypothetical protein